MYQDRATGRIGLPPFSALPGAVGIDGTDVDQNCCFSPDGEFPSQYPKTSPVARDNGVVDAGKR